MAARADQLTPVSGRPGGQATPEVYVVGATAHLGTNTAELDLALGPSSPVPGGPATPEIYVVGATAHLGTNTAELDLTICPSSPVPGDPAARRHPRSTLSVPPRTLAPTPQSSTWPSAGSTGGCSQSSGPAR
ncbi:hypothetical protein GCM10009625_10060 [Brachybacterium fresconis]